MSWIENLTKLNQSSTGFSELSKLLKEANNNLETIKMNEKNYLRLLASKHQNDDFRWLLKRCCDNFNSIKENDMENGFKIADLMIKMINRLTLAFPNEFYSFRVDQNDSQWILDLIKDNMNSIQNQKDILSVALQIFRNVRASRAESKIKSYAIEMCKKLSHRKENDLQIYYFMIYLNAFEEKETDQMALDGLDKAFNNFEQKLNDVKEKIIASETLPEKDLKPTIVKIKHLISTLNQNVHSAKLVEIIERSLKDIKINFKKEIIEKLVKNKSKFKKYSEEVFDWFTDVTKESSHEFQLSTILLIVYLSNFLCQHNKSSSQHIEHIKSQLNSYYESAKSSKTELNEIIKVLHYATKDCVLVDLIVELFGSDDETFKQNLFKLARLYTNTSFISALTRRQSDDALNGYIKSLSSENYSFGGDSSLRQVAMLADRMKLDKFGISQQKLNWNEFINKKINEKMIFETHLNKCLYEISCNSVTEGTESKGTNWENVVTYSLYTDLIVYIVHSYIFYIDKEFKANNSVEKMESKKKAHVKIESKYESAELIKVIQAKLGFTLNYDLTKQD